MLINKYKTLWDKLEISKSRPAYASKVVTINYNEFADKVEKQDDNFVRETVYSLFNGGLCNFFCCY